MPGVSWKTKGKIPKIPANVFCKECWIYETKYDYGRSPFLGGEWDYATCYFACLKRGDLEH